MKFSTVISVGVVYGNHVKAQQCFALALKEKGSNHYKTNTIGSLTNTPKVAQLTKELGVKV